MARKSLVIAKFKIYPDHERRKHRKFFTVWIFRSKRTMYRFSDEQCRLSGVENVHDFEAQCQGWQTVQVQPGREDIRRPDIGCLLFHKSRCRIGIISHECTHAALHWARINKVMPTESKAEEEEFCWVLGNLVRQVVIHWNKHRDPR